MPRLRLLLTFALALAIPLQGLAAASCTCKLHQAARTHAMAGAAPAHLPSTASSKHYMAAADARAADQARPVSLHAGSPVQPAAPHRGCPKCSMGCCQAAAFAPGVAALELANTHIERVHFMPALFTSWTEPVPHKPPRA